MIVLGIDVGGTHTDAALMDDGRFVDGVKVSSSKDVHPSIFNALDVLTGFTRRPDQRGWFCSELVAELYRRFGWLPLDIRPSTLVPGHFGSRHMRLQHGKLGPVEWLKSALPLDELSHEDGGNFTASAELFSDMPAIAHRTAGHETFLPPQSHVAG